VVPCGTLIGFSLFCFSTKVPVYVVREGFLSAGTGASWECLCLMRLTYRLMTENCSDDQSSVTGLPFLVRNDIVEVKETNGTFLQLVPFVALMKTIILTINR